MQVRSVVFMAVPTNTAFTAGLSQDATHNRLNEIAVRVKATDDSGGVILIT